MTAGAGSAMRAWRLAAVAAGAVVVVDQAAKQLVVTSIARGEHEKFFLGINLTNVRNPGVAFGALGGSPLITILTVTAIVLLAAYFSFHASMPMLWLPFGVVVGGALGNLADRAREGAVVDFIDFVIWPTFNVADAAIVIGILGLLYVIEGPSPGDDEKTKT